LVQVVVAILKDFVNVKYLYLKCAIMLNLLGEKNHIMFSIVCDNLTHNYNFASTSMKF
jgi:hypothetical protein